jgi:hypothetical protein
VIAPAYFFIARASERRKGTLELDEDPLDDPAIVAG